MKVYLNKPGFERRAAHAALLAGASLMTMIAVPAFAQETPAPTPAADVPQDTAAPQGEIVVTGSRIKSPTLTSPSPLQVITNEDLRKQGTTNVQDILQINPAV